MTQALIHWCMLECLAHEAILGDWPYGPERIVSGELFMDVLFKEFVRHDPRFHRQGMGWDEASQEVSYEGKHGLEAVAAFLGLDRPHASTLLKSNYDEPYKARQALRLKTRMLEREMGLEVPDRFWDGFPRKMKEMDGD